MTEKLTERLPTTDRQRKRERERQRQETERQRDKGSERSSRGESRVHFAASFPPLASWSIESNGVEDAVEL